MSAIHSVLFWSLIVALAIPVIAIELFLRVKHKLSFLNEALTDEMRAEIQQLGLSVKFFERLAMREGLKFTKYYLESKKSDSCLFQKWYPRVLEYVEQCRLQSPFPDPDELGFEDRTSLAIVRKLVHESEHVPTYGNFTATFFSAPLHTLPTVMSQWPSKYSHPVFLTPQELHQWRMIYKEEEPNQDSWWFQFQDWNVNWSPEPDWFDREPFETPDGDTPLLVIHGLVWGPLAGGHKWELWSVDTQGDARMIKVIHDVVY